MTAAPAHLELPITGMTCASCANRIERRLNKLDGVSATVNYATERAAVDFDPAIVVTNSGDVIPNTLTVGIGSKMANDSSGVVGGARFSADDFTQ